MTTQKPLKPLTDKQFHEQKLRATICPGQCEWPKPENVVWQKLHAAADEARARVSKAYMQMDEIDRNAGLSRDERYPQRSEIGLVLNCWVIETKDTPLDSKASTILAKSKSERVSRSIL
jgi:hypothetical protein